MLVISDSPDDDPVGLRTSPVPRLHIRAGDNLNWLHLRLHDATGCRYAHWEALLAGGPEPPPPASG
ncbi:hypothetical protein ACFQ7M_41080 [Streptomyces massasporeus]